LLAVGPHTSNWDFVFGLAALFSLGIKISWMGKRTIFRKPFGRILRWFGGIPIERSASSGIVDTMINQFNKSKQFILALAPEGTRSKVDQWKTGFYHIANGAGVPILMVCFDYKDKVISFGPLIYPCGDAEVDIKKMQTVFSKIQGKKNQ
jgi:1-acyl-sn-glycerol-3-phosphate acyltransferase